MYKGFCEDVEYVMGLFFKPFEGCCPDDEEEEDKDCGFGCDFAPCCKDEEDGEDEEDEGKGCDAPACCREEENDEEQDGPSKGGGLLGAGPLQDVLKCMFDASDTDYDYED